MDRFSVTSTFPENPGGRTMLRTRLNDASKAAMKERYAGRMDFHKASAQVKERLG